MSTGTQSSAPAGRRRPDPLGALASVAEQRAQHGRRLTGLLRVVLRQLDRLFAPFLLAEPGGVVLVHLLPAGQRRVGQLRRPIEQQHPAAEQDHGSAAHQAAIGESTAEPCVAGQRSTSTANTSGPWRTYTASRRMSCTSIPLADSPWRRVTAGAPSMARVAVRFSGAVAYPIDRSRTAGWAWGSEGAAGVAGRAAACAGESAVAGAATGVGAEGTTAGGAASAATTGGARDLRRSTRARGGSSRSAVLGTVADRGIGTCAGGRCEGWVESSRRGGSVPSEPRRISGTLAAAAASPTTSAHRHADHSRRSVQAIAFPAAGVSRGSRCRSASRIVLTKPPPTGS